VAKAAAGEGKKQAAADMIGSRIPPNARRSRDNVVHKVDCDVAQVAITIHVRFRCVFQMFHVLHTYVTSVSCGY
jgi:hypothetical protein